nr:HtaA domain-containing protein [Patulibacter sp. SYSU D01012]
MSADGRRVAFLSRARNLAPGAVSGTVDLLYVRDLQRGTTRRISTRCTTEGCAPATQRATAPRISADGRYVVFRTNEGLVPADTDGTADVYRYDVETGTNELVTDGTVDDVGGAASTLAVSGDGRLVAYVTQLVPGAAALGAYAHAVVRDLDRPLGAAGAQRLLDARPDGGPADYSAQSVALSADGRTAVFSSRAGDLDGLADTTREPSDRPNGVFAVDLREEASRPRRVSVGPDGRPYDAGFAGAAAAQALSADGTRILVGSSDPGTARLAGVPEAHADDQQVYVLDPADGTLRAVVVDEAGRPAGSAYAAALSADGTKVAFVAPADLRPLDADAGATHDQVFVRDLLGPRIERATLGAAEETTDAAATAPQISGDGRYVAFVSAATRLTPAGTWGTQVFRRDTRAPDPAAPAGLDAPAPVAAGPLETVTTVVAPVPPTAARAATLTAGTLDLRRRAAAPAARALRAAGVRVTATRPATTRGGRVRLTVRGGRIGTLARADAAGAVVLRRTAGGRTRRVVLRDVRAEVGTRVRVTARVGTERLTVFTATGVRGRVVNPWSGRAALRTATLRLTATATRELRARLGTTRLRAGRYGTVALRARSTARRAGTAGTPGATVTTTAPTAAAAPGAPASDGGPVREIGTLSWGFQSSFRRYVRGGDGQPPLEAGDGARYVAAEDTFRFAATESTYDPATRTGRIAARGWIRFNYPGHFFFITVQDPTLLLDGDVGTLEGAVRSDLFGKPGTLARTRIATLDLRTAGRATAGGAVSLSGVVPTLVEEAVPSFGGFWRAGQVLDPIAVTLDAR